MNALTVYLGGSELFEYVLVLLGAAVPGLEIMLAIPLGIVRGLSPVAVTVLGFLGNLLTVVLVIVIYQRLKDWWDRRKKEPDQRPAKRTERAERIWNRYGLPGLALLGPILIGSHLAAFIALAFGASKWNTAVWLVISLALWSLVFGILTAMGFDFFVRST